MQYSIRFTLLALLVLMLAATPASGARAAKVLVCPAEGELSPDAEGWIRYGFQNYLGDLLRLSGGNEICPVGEQEGYLRGWIARRSVSFQDMSLKAGRNGYDWILTAESDGDMMTLLAFEVTGATIHQLATFDPWGDSMDWQDEALENLDELIPGAGSAVYHAIATRAAFENLEQAIWQKNVAYMQHGDKSFPDQAAWKSAIKWIRSAILADPRHAPTRFHAGHIYHIVRFAWRGVKEFDQFFTLAPSATDFADEAGKYASKDWYFLGYRDWEKKDMVSAESSFARAVNLNPKNAQAWYWLGRVRMEKGDHDGSTKAFAHAAALQPNDDLARYFKEREMRSAKVGGAAWDAFERGILAYGQDRFEESRRHFKTAVSMNPGWFEARYWLARVCIVELEYSSEGRKIVDRMSAEEKSDSRVQYLIKVLKWK